MPQGKPLAQQMVRDTDEGLSPRFFAGVQVYALRESEGDGDIDQARREERNRHGGGKHEGIVIDKGNGLLGKEKEMIR